MHSGKHIKKDHLRIWKIKKKKYNSIYLTNTIANLEKLYQSIANLKELGWTLHEETLKTVDNMEEELIKNEIIPRLSESIEGIITQIQRPIVFVFD